MRYNEILESLDDSDEDLFGIRDGKEFKVIGPDGVILSTQPTLGKAREYALSQVPDYFSVGYGQKEDEYLHILKIHDDNYDDPEVVDAIPIQASAVQENDEADDELFGTNKKWYVYIWGNWNTGRYADYQPRKFIVPGRSAEDARRWVDQNEIRIIQYFEQAKDFRGKRLLPKPAAKNLFLDQTRVEGEAPEDSPLSKFARGRGNAL